MKVLIFVVSIFSIPAFACNCMSKPTQTRESTQITSFDGMALTAKFSANKEKPQALESTPEPQATSASIEDEFKEIDDLDADYDLDTIDQLDLDELETETLAINFNTNSTELAPADQQKLEAFVKQVPKGQKIEVIGYADSRGSEEYNKVLSEKRAQAVKEWLKKWNVDQSSVLTQGAGEVDKKDHANARVVEVKVVQ